MIVKGVSSWICQKVLTIVKVMRLTCLIWSSHTRSVQEPAISIYGKIKVLYRFILYPCDRIFGNLLETKRPGSKELNDPTVSLWVGPGLNWLHHHQAKQEEQHLAYEHWQVRNQQVAIKVLFQVHAHLCCFLKSKTDTGCHKDWLLYHFCDCAHPAAAESNMLIAVCVTVSAFFVCSHLPVNKMSDKAANMFLFCL